MTFADQGKVEQAIRDLLLAIGEDPDREGLVDTPRRVAKAYQELLAGYGQQPGQLLARSFDREGYDQVVVLRGVRFWSMCEHHLLPFYGTADVAYLAGDKVLGLSKLARLVQVYARRLQLQERMTEQVARALMDLPGAQGAAVVVRGQHLCMMARGASQQDAEMVTSAMLGCFRDDPKARDEVLQLMRSGA